ncbi:hypothetical protein BQ8420_21580 [Nocardiopsis sp. JB363]|nr:hypothetical protein BQ8420_21580 [Nocardiopsis sp. JB363]
MVLLHLVGRVGLGGQSLKYRRLSESTVHSPTLNRPNEPSDTFKNQSRL